MCVAGEADRADAMFAILETKTCDVIVLDISMPGKSGLEALKELKQRFPAIPVLILSIYGEDQYGIRALKAGASGFPITSPIWRLRFWASAHEIAISFVRGRGR